jgi:hypothetical protein
MNNLDSELWMRQRMLDHRGPDVFDGTTDFNSRKQRIREAIKHCGLETVVIGSNQGKPVNWRAAFESLYGEPL